MPLRTSWVAVTQESHFPIQNLPYGVFALSSDSKEQRIGVAIGTQVLDLGVLADAGLFKGKTALGDGSVFKEPVLNSFMGLGKAAWAEARQIIGDLLDKDTATLRDNAELRAKALHPQEGLSMRVPARIGDYTDFYSSRYHAYNVGVMFRGKDNALQPNWTHLPVGYHGRASSVVVSGTDLKRPKGQLITPDTPQGPPTHGTCRLMDFELEMALYVGSGNKLGEPMTMDDAENSIFGLTTMNDWSARDIQKWEYVPLGPFGAKNFGTTVSPWIVTMEALEPFRIENQRQEPEPLAYLKETRKEGLECYDIKLEVTIQGAEHKEPQRISLSNAKYLYWNFKQQLVHHTVTGCNMNPGDLLGSGTISGPTDTEYGSMLELSWKGTKEVAMADGSIRKFLKDGDEVNMIGWCQGEGYRVGFGDCKGRVLPQ
jgi:fumarylacetoacetase